MADEVEIALGKRFLGRRDVKAVQLSDGHYEPHVQHAKHSRGTLCTPECQRLPWNMAALRDHVTGGATYGHYLVDPTGLVKLFAYDLDLKTTGYYISMDEKILDPVTCNPREVWLDQNHPGRESLLIQLRCTAEALAMKAHTMLDGECHVAIAYSGGKGLHVYCFFPEPQPAADARKIAADVLKSMNEPNGRPSYQRTKGENFWESAVGTPNIEIEVFPKQDGVQDLGNLMRLPLGVNRKTGQRAYFLDCRCAYNEMKLMEPQAALGSELPWD